MNSKVFERAMFKTENKPTKATSGITQGFDEDYEEDEEISGDEMAEEVSKRTPRSPEILMNNLRGDMRSVDARYQELAEMVGEDVAMETPPEILAMLQPQLMAQQAPTGIGALPTQGVPPPPPPGGAPMPTPPQMGGMPPVPPQMPQGPMPTDQGAMPAPQGFAYGGMVGSAPGYGPMSMMAPPMYQGAMAPQGYAKGGIASLPQAGANYNPGIKYDGPLEAGANYIRGAGRNGDTMLAHMTPEQHQVLSMMGGGSTTNPKTGLPEHFMGAGAATNLMQRIQPYAQAANQYIGSRMAPVLTPPTMQQSRTTLGTFGPRTVEGMELTYPTLTQRIGTATEPVRQAITNMPGYQKAGAALATIPGGKVVMDAFGGGQTVPNMPPSDIPAVIGTDAEGKRTYTSPPIAPVPEAKMPEVEQTEVQQVMAPPTAPKTEEELIEKQGKKKDKLENRLEAYMQENLPVFEKYMGGDKEASQIQALFLLADAGLEYATKPGRTGMIALANAFKRVPAGLAQIAAQEDARKTQIKGAALTSGLQTIAAEDKADAAIRRVVAQELAKGKDVATESLGAGLTLYKTKSGKQDMMIDPQVTSSFINSRFTPQVQKDKEGNVVGFNTPYARVSEGSQTINLDKSTRERLAGDVSRQEIAIAKLDDAIKMYTDTAFGPKAFFANFKNNVLVPVSPLKPNTLTEEQRTKINTAMNTAIKAIARAGDTGNIAVAEQTAAASILGDKPGTFFSDYETALKRLMTVRTDLANQRLTTANQLGWINQDIQLDVPNLGTPSDPIPQDKLGYLTSIKQVNPNAQVYVNINGKSTPVLLSTLKE